MANMTGQRLSNHGLWNGRWIFANFISEKQMVREKEMTK